jgi:DNA-binding GntR family transcriptional regulator
MAVATKGRSQGSRANLRRSNLLTNEAYKQLRDLIIDGQLHPNDRLVETELADRLNVSRTPVREALRKLFFEGLVAEAPRNGYIVAEFSPQFIIDNYAVREALEGLAARLAANNATDLELMQLRVELDSIARASKSNDLAKLADHNVNFHRIIAKASRNVVLTDILAALQDRLRLLRSSNFLVSSRREEALKEQRNLLKAIEARDADKAEQLARLHVRNARQVRLAALCQPAE